MGDPFASLRTHLDQSPSRSVFQRVLALLDEWPEPGSLELGLSYAAEHLDAWDDDDRLSRASVCWPTFPYGEPKPIFSLVRYLNADLMELKEKDAAPLAALPQLQQLRGLSLRENHLGDSGVVALVSSPHLAQLEALVLTANEVQEKGMQAIAQSPYLSQLEQLELYQTWECVSSGHLLAASPYLKRLFVLDLGFHGIGRDGLSSLFDSEVVADVGYLGLAGCGLCGDLSTLTQHIHAARLQGMVLNYNEIDDDAIEAICASDVLLYLGELTLNGNEITDRGIELLLDYQLLEALTKLELEENLITDEGALMLAQSPQLQGLEQLGLYGNAISDLGYGALAQSPYLRPTLRKQCLDAVSDDGILRDARDRGLSTDGETPYELRSQLLALCQEE